ncbi:hypothetical protein CDEF62S_06397 [Castellaniella defragrans]
MHSLEDHAALDAFDVEDAFVTQQVGAVDLHDAAQEVFQAFRVEGAFRAKQERPDGVVVMGVMVVMAAIRATFVVAVLVVMIVMVVFVIMAMIVILVLLAEEFRVDVQDVVDVEAADVQQGVQIGFAEMRRRDRCPGIDVHEARTQRFVVRLVDQVFLGNQDAVGEPDLTLGFFLAVERGHAVLGVHHGDHRIQLVGLGDLVVHEKGLADRPGVGHARGFDDDAVEVHRTGVALKGQVAQGAHQVATYRAADAAVAQLDDLLFAVLHQDVIVDVFFAELVLDDGDALPVVFGEYPSQQRGLAGAQKTCEHGHGNQGVNGCGGICGVHDYSRCLRKWAPTEACHCANDKRPITS